MTDDRADVIERVAKSIRRDLEDEEGHSISHHYAMGIAKRALDFAGLLSTPADQDELRDYRSSLAFGVSCLACARMLEAASTETERAERAEAKNALLRAQVAAVRALIFRHYTGSPGFEKTPEHILEIDALADLYDEAFADELRAAIATAGGEQHGE